MRDFSLTPRSEGTREPRPVADPVQFTLAQIKAHFDESLASIQSQFAVAEDLKTNGKTDECKDIWRSQIVFLEGILDFYIHEMSKYAVYQMFLGRWSKSQKYENLQIKMSDVETALNSPESKIWFFKFLNERFSRDVFLSVESMKDQLNLLSLNFCDVMKTAFSANDENAGKKFIRELFERRNAIAHQVDRSHTTAEKNDISREYVEECISGLRSIVYAIHNKAEEKDRTSL